MVIRAKHVRRGFDGEADVTLNEARVEQVLHVRNEPLLHQGHYGHGIGGTGHRLDGVQYESVRILLDPDTRIGKRRVRLRRIDRGPGNQALIAFHLALPNSPQRASQEMQPPRGGGTVILRPLPATEWIMRITLTHSSLA